MKFLSKEKRQEHKNSSSCTAFEYPMADADINGAVIELSGRYPDKNRTMNTECKEMAYVISGSGILVIETKEITLNEGDLVLIEPNEKYYFEGNLKMFMPCTPAWHPEQHREVK